MSARTLRSAVFQNYPWIHHRIHSSIGGTMRMQVIGAGRKGLALTAGIAAQ
ncbi:hypothetical protein PWP93_33085 [Paraburkholderia sp. A1RI-2L]|uniref:hypothetical protein n=1 Tax=Paraburkholderia sp. A1RI-2L TaxID=3028367 RepID=UPI003B77558C